jgi:tetratricopeptide (TPR) repeat protein
MTTQESLNLAVQRHQAGDLVQAEGLYRQILAIQPNQADALHLLGVLAHQVGREDAALELIQRAIVLRPNTADHHNNLGLVLAAQGKLDQAIAAYRHALTLRPHHPDAQYNLGLALSEKGLWDLAIEELKRTADSRPGDAGVQRSLARTLRRAGRLEAAISVYRNALGLPADQVFRVQTLKELGDTLVDHQQAAAAVSVYRQALDLTAPSPELLNNLGNALKDTGRAEEAIACFERALTMMGEHSDAAKVLVNLADALHHQRDFPRSADVCRRALALRPAFAAAHNHLGKALAGMGRMDEALAEYQRTLEIDPKDADARNNIGNLHHAEGELDQAIECYRHVLAAHPGHALAHWNLGLALLAQGDFQRGWPEYEWRSRVRQFAGKAALPAPVWDGGELNGRHILLHAEQGFGDAIQFARYIPLVARRGGKIVLACQPELIALFRSLEGIEQIVPMDQPPQCDVQCPLPSLPLKFKTTSETIPASVPYLSARAELAQAWHERLSGDDRLKVGLVWAGRPAPDPDRSIPSEDLTPLGTVDGVRWVSLQHGGPRRPPPVPLDDWTAELKDFSDTAALIANLDAVISIDTAAAHLAGAMGKLTWVLLKKSADWRWLLDRNDSPWYPTIRVFRQHQSRQWNKPIQLAVEALISHRDRRKESGPRMDTKEHE